MKSLKNILQINEERRSNPDRDPWDARGALQDEVMALSKKVDLFFGSAADVASSSTLRVIAQEINQLRSQVAKMADVLEKEVKITDENIYKLLKRYQ